MSERIAYNVDEATQTLGVSRRHLYRLMDSGAIDSFHEGRRRLISRRALEAYIDQREKEARAERAKAA